MDEIYVTKDNVFPISLEQLIKEHPNKFKAINFEAKGTVIGSYNPSHQEALRELSEKLPKGIDIVCNVKIKTKDNYHTGISGSRYHETSYFAIGIGYAKTEKQEGYLKKHQL